VTIINLKIVNVAFGWEHSKQQEQKDNFSFRIKGNVLNKVAHGRVIQSVRFICEPPT